MKTVIICPPNKNPLASTRLTKLGYKWETFWSNDIELSDVRQSECLTFMRGRSLEDLEKRPHVRHLRNNWQKILVNYADFDEKVLFLEEDACPQITAEDLEEAVDRELSNYKVDILRLFQTLVNHNGGRHLFSKNSEFEWFRDSSLCQYTDYHYGSHAYFIPKRSRIAMARIFSSYRLPTDTAVEMACAKGDLVMRVSKDNLFTQGIHGSTL